MHGNVTDMIRTQTRFELKGNSELSIFGDPGQIVGSQYHGACQKENLKGGHAADAGQRFIAIYSDLQRFIAIYCQLLSAFSEDVSG